MSKSSLVLIGADKGGVGKTMVARALLDYYSTRGVPYRAFDAELITGVLRRFRPEAELADVTTVPGQMKVLDGMGGVVTVVDLRAGALTPLLKALATTGMMDQVRSGTFDLLVLHVQGPTVASEGEVPEIVTALKGARHVLVRSYAAPGTTFREFPIELPVIVVPNLNEVAAEAVDRNNATFVAFSRDPTQSATLRGYVSHWLAQVWLEFDRIGVTPAV